MLVSDIDMLHEQFFAIQASGSDNFKFQNVPFVLNVIDSLAGDTRFLEIRKGRQQYGYLTTVGNILYFAASGTTGGKEFWGSDGTGPGTYQVKDIASGLSRNSPKRRRHT